MPVRVSRAFVRRQLAFRRLLLDANGNLSRDGRVVVAELRRLLGAGPGQHLTKFGPTGVDPVATVAAAQRREVWDSLVRLVNLDAYTVANIDEDT